MRIVGVNGIATHGAGNIDVLLQEMRARGFETRDVRLPRRYALSARWGGCKDGQIVAQHSQDDDIIVAHSFGCLRAWHAHQVRNYRAIVCIAPAMGQRVKWRDPLRVHCWHSLSDWAIRIGKLLILHPIGGAGNRGFSQPGVVNHDAKGAGHSDYFRGPRLKALADSIVQLA